MPTKKDSDVSTRVKKRIKLASELPQNQNILIYGAPGTGKTRLCATAPKPLIVDVDEEGTDSIRRDLDCPVYQVKLWQEVNDLYWFLQEGEHDFETVCIDKITGLQTLCMNFILKDEAARDASRDPDMPSRQVWGKVGQLMKTQITNFRNLPMNVIFTADVRAKEGGDEDAEEVIVTYGPEVSPSVAKHLNAAVGTIGWLQKREVFVRNKKTKKKRREIRRRLMFEDNERYVSKDRNGRFGAYIDAPDLTEMLALIYSKED